MGAGADGGGGGSDGGLGWEERIGLWWGEGGEGGSVTSSSSWRVRQDDWIKQRAAAAEKHWMEKKGGGLLHVS